MTLLLGLRAGLIGFRLPDHLCHFDTRAFSCRPDVGPCEKILTSNSSHFLGIPVPILGLAYFAPMSLLCLPAAWRSPDRRIHLARLILSILGIGMIIYLFAEELFVLQSLCVWCSITSTSWDSSSS